MSGEAQGRWSLIWIPQTQTDLLAAKLSEGWEPFAVVGPSGPASSLPPVVYLRRCTEGR